MKDGYRHVSYAGSFRVRYCKDKVLRQHGILDEHTLKSRSQQIDSAIAYRNEAPSAKGLLDTKLPRDELFFTSKIPPTYFGYESAKVAIAETLAKIGDLGYIGER